jgi:plasmid maintenance system antidote protein VapI
MKSISGILKESIRACGLSDYELSRKSGVNRQSIARFLSGETRMYHDGIDRLARYFNLELTPATKPKASKKGAR